MREKMYASRFLPPLLAFCAARLVFVRAASWAKQNGWAAQSWGRWDSAHYLSIAERGYELFSCARLPGYDPNAWCGNTGWFPAFPLLIRVGRWLSLAPVFVGALIAALFCLAMLIALWNLFLQSRCTAGNLVALAAAAFFPGAVYDHAVFPLSLVTLLHVLALHAHVQRKPGWAGAFGGAGAFAYGSGLFLAAVLAIDLVLRDGRKPSAHLLKCLSIECGLVVVGFGAALFVQFLDVGVWHGYFVVQSKYGHTNSFPWVTYAGHIQDIARGDWRAYHWQTASMPIIAATNIWAAARSPREPLDRLLLIFFLVYWLVPLALGSNLSLYRAEALLLPSVALWRKLPLWLSAPMLLAAMFLASKLALLFFKNVLV